MSGNAWEMTAGRYSDSQDRFFSIARGGNYLDEARIDARLTGTGSYIGFRVAAPWDPK
jgi:hypothetical protein